MHRNQTRTPLLSLLALAGALIASGLLDLLVKNLQFGIGTISDPTAALWIYALGNLVNALVVVSLVRYALSRSALPRLVHAVYLLTGLVVTFYPPVVLSGWLGQAPMFSPASYLAACGAAAALVGAFLLLRSS